MSDLLDATSWAITEFADADLGDLRRTQRLVQLAHALAQRPGAALPEACGSGAMLKATYRFFINDDIARDDILQSHIESTYSRLNAAPLVLAVHPDDIGKRARRKQLPISQKESQKWLHSLDAVYTARDCCPTTHMISVGDREADVYDVLAAPRPVGVDLLIRASWNRCVNAPQRYVWDTVEAQPMVAHLHMHVPRRGPQPAREATLALRFCPVTLRPPQHRKAEDLPAVTLWAVHVDEVEPPAEVEPIEWLLFTTVAVETVDDAIARVQWYSCRWGIEVWHRILKSGCHLEARQFPKAERLRRVLALYSVLAR